MPLILIALRLYRLTFLNVSRSGYSPHPVRSVEPLQVILSQILRLRSVLAYEIS